MKLYFLTSLSPPVQSCPVSQAILSCVPPALQKLNAHSSYHMFILLFQQIWQGLQWKSASSAHKSPPELYYTPLLWWEPALKACLCRVPGDGCMHTHDVGRWEKALIPGRMTFCRTALCRDSYEGSNTEAKHWVSSSSMEARGKHS